MGILQDFERRLQGAVGNTFARLFGGTVHPSEVINAIQTEASSRLENQNGRTIAPNRFKVRLGLTDRSGIGDDDQRVAAALADSIRAYVDEQGWDTFGNIEVDFEESPALHTGQFRISSLIDPDAGRQRHVNRPPTSRGERMSQPPSDPYRQSPANQPYQPPPSPPQYPAQQNYPPQPGYYPPAQSHPGQQYRDDYYREPQYQQDSVAALHVDGSGRSYQLERGSNVIGRGQDAAFRLPDTAVSRRHVDIYFDGAIAVMHDLGSTNGTTVNGTSVRTWQLADGDVIRVGHSTLMFSQQG